MLFVMVFTEAIVLPPAYLGSDLSAIVKAKLIEKVEGSCTERYGYIVCVLKVDDPRTGKILDTSGDVLFSVEYKAVVLKPFVNEVLDGVVEKIDKYGATVTVGPVLFFISNKNFHTEFEFNEGTNSYVSSQQQNEKIAVDVDVRFRVLGTKFDSNIITGTGTMREDYLGPFRT
jgi:DNA-directed RNA polymerase II subunit RPB7